MADPPSITTTTTSFLRRAVFHAATHTHTTNPPNPTTTTSSPPSLFSTLARLLQDESIAEVAYNYREQTIYLTILYTLLIFSIIYFLLRYANRSLFKWHTWINIFVSYFCAIGILVLIPLDLAVVHLTREATTLEQLSQLELYSNSLYQCYGAMFWPTQIFAGILLYFFEEYNESGYFTVPTRIGDAFRNIAKFAGLGLVVGGILLGVILGGGYVNDEKALLVTVIAINNTYGLVVIIFLLGYGLVELPKQMWMNGNLQGKLRRLRQKAAHEFRALADASMDMSEIVAHALKTKAEIEKQASTQHPHTHNPKDYFFKKSQTKNTKDTSIADRELLTHCLPKLLKECPDEFHSTHGGVAQVDTHTHRVTRDSLAALRKTVKRRKAKYQMCQSRVERLKREVFALEDIVAAKHRNDHVKKIQYANGQESKTTKFLYECYVRPISSRFFSLLIIIMCLCVLLAEAGLYAGQSSPVAILARGNHDADLEPSGIIVFNLFFIGFIASVCLFALSQLRLADVMEIAPEQKTTPKSMSYNARLSCKLAPPLAYNFLTLCFESGLEKGAWMDSAVTGERVSTAFSRFYGSMDIIPFLGDNFNRIFPVFVLVLCVLQGLNVFNRVLAFFHLEGLQFGDPVMGKKDLEEGLKKLQKYRQQMEAAAQREERMRKIRGSGGNLGATMRVAPLGGGAGAGDGGEGEGGGGSDTEGDEVLGGYGDSTGGPSRYNPANGPPALKEGWIEKKTGREASGGGWQNRYFVVRGPGVLVHYKKQDKSGSILGTLDLSKVLTISLNVGGDGITDATRLNVETSEGTMKLRCRSEDLAGEWRQALSEWREYALAQRMGGIGTFAAHASVNGGGNNITSIPSFKKEDDEAPAASLLPSSVPNSSSSSSSTTTSSPSSSSNPRGASSASAALSSFMSRLAPNNNKTSSSSSSAGGHGGGGGGLFSSSSSSTTRGSKNRPAMPRPLGGKLLLNGGLFSSYTEKNFMVKSSDASLKWYKVGDSTSTMGPPVGSLDMRSVEKVTYEEPKAGTGQKRDSTKFVVCVTGGKVGEAALKLKAESPAEAEMWINGLMEWANYFKATASAGVGGAGKVTAGSSGGKIRMGRLL